MRNSYPIVEKVLKIDSGDYIGKFIFPEYSADARIHQNVKALIVGAINGNQDPLVKAYDGENRTGKYKLVNIRLIRGYEEVTVDVPADIKLLIEEYNGLFPEYRDNMNNEEEPDLELYKELSELSSKLLDYFER